MSEIRQRKTRGLAQPRGHHPVSYKSVCRYRLNLRAWNRRKKETGDSGLERFFVCVVYEEDNPGLAFFQPASYFAHICARTLNQSYFANTSATPPVHTKTFKEWYNTRKPRF